MFNDSIITALEDLIKAIRNESKLSIDLAVSDAVEALGYDPSEPNEYLVSLEIGVTAKNPEEAVREFMKLLDHNPSNEWVYKVTDDNDVEEIVDTYRWKK